MKKTYKTKTGKYTVEYKNPTMRERMEYTDMCSNTGKKYGSSSELLKILILSVNGNSTNPADQLLDLPVSESAELLEIRDMLFNEMFPSPEKSEENAQNLP